MTAVLRSVHQTVNVVVDLSRARDIYEFRSWILLLILACMTHLMSHHARQAFSVAELSLLATLLQLPPSFLGRHNLIVQTSARTLLQNTSRSCVTLVFSA